MVIDSRIKVYLDTSVISYLDQQDAQVEMVQIHQVWEKIKAGKVTTQSTTKH